MFDGKKLKILVVNPNQGGCAYYRSLMPYHKLQELYPDLVDIKFDENPLKLDLKTGKFEYPGAEAGDAPPDMKWAHVVLINNISNFGGPYTAKVQEIAHKAGKFVHFDTDDLLTELYDEHHLIDVYKNQGLSELTKHLYYNSHLVTVTQVKFAERIKPFCRGVLAVVKNAIDYRLPGWNHPKVPSKAVRIGWAGGIHHNPDVKIFSSVPHLVNQKVGRENVFWDFYGMPPPPKDEKEKKDWQNQVWHFYKAELLKGFKGQRNWNTHYAVGPSDYGVFYANMDIAIAPLQMNAFNDSKSDIKVAEAGRYKVPLVASNIGCYSDVIKNGQTGYLLDPDAPKSEWIRILSKLVKDHKHRKELGENLHKITEELFDVNKVVKHRLDIYDKCFEAMNYKLDGDSQ
jgi:glycosyltransferase involved in cell wall biosynthesis